MVAGTSASWGSMSRTTLNATARSPVLVRVCTSLNCSLFVRPVHAQGRPKGVPLHIWRWYRSTMGLDAFGCQEPGGAERSVQLAVVFAFNMCSDQQLIRAKLMPSATTLALSCQSVISSSPLNIASRVIRAFGLYMTLISRRTLMLNQSLLSYSALPVCRRQ